jgi:hypothetical protein
MKLREQAVIFTSIEENDVHGTFGEPYAVAHIKSGDEELRVVFGRQIPENYAQLSKISQALGDGDNAFETKVSVTGFVNIGKLDGTLSPLLQKRMPLARFPALDEVKKSPTA